jgi:hypothetical protein
MIRGQDVVVLLKLHCLGSEWTIRSLAEAVPYHPTGVTRSLTALAAARLYDPARRQPLVANSEEFLIHAVKYVFPAALGAPTRGFPTAWAAPPLDDLVARGDAEIPVWPHRSGPRRGFAVRPVHALAVEAAARDPLLREWLTLLDAIRIGEARERKLAAEMISARLLASAAETAA